MNVDIHSQAHNDVMPSPQSPLVPIKFAASKVGYTPDYVGRLCREGKVVALQQSRQWLVDLESLKLFSLQTEAEKRWRQQRLSEVRRADLVTKQFSTQRAHQLEQAIKPQPLIAAYSGLVVVAGCLLAMVFQTTLPLLGTLHQPAAAGFVVEDTQLDDVPTQAVLTPHAEVVRESPENLVVFDSNATSGAVDLVRQQFSDEVHITFETVDSGLITPVFKNRSTTSYRFLMVPVNHEGE